MNWWSAKILIVSHVAGAVDYEPICEHSIRVLQAEDQEEALREAERVGRAEDHGYLNADDEKVTWRFKAVIEVQDLHEAELTHGTEVFSTMSRAESS